MAKAKKIDLMKSWVADFCNVAIDDLSPWLLKENGFYLLFGKWRYTAPWIILKEDPTYLMDLYNDVTNLPMGLSFLIRWIKSERTEVYYVFRNKVGQIHRDKKPAILYWDQSIEYYKHGKVHRLHGPAIVRYEDGCPYLYEYWIDGKLHNKGNKPARLFFHRNRCLVGYFIHGQKIEDYVMMSDSEARKRFPIYDIISS